MQITFGKAQVNNILFYSDKSELKGDFEILSKKKIFEGKANTLQRFSSLENGAMKYTIYCGLGDLNDEVKVRNSLSVMFKSLADTKVVNWGVSLKTAFEKDVKEEDIAKLIEQFALMSELALYKFKGYKSTLLTQTELCFSIAVNETELYQTAINKGLSLGKGVCIARDLGNRHAADIYPETLADFAVEQGKACGFKTTVYDKKWLKKEGFGGILAVGKGSKHAPVLIVMEYNGAGDEPYTAYVGKGVTFDAGGYNLKDTKTIVSMKVDMCGAANVLGLMTALAKNKVEKNVLCVIPSAENLVDAKAFLPGTVLTMYSGKTVEITNTDAEGRLLLADAINYVAKMEKVEKIIDIATLTGSVAMTFGADCCAVMTNNDTLLECTKRASKKTGELVWQLPLFEESKERIVSTIADYRNSGATPAAGGIIAGLFLKEFCENKPWIHIDIAGTANAPMPKGVNPAGATGFGVRLMYQLLCE